MIYRSMPAVWEPKFRSTFYERWGRESAVISARARRAEYPEFRQLLSIKAAIGGREDYFIDGRQISVDDDTFATLRTVLFGSDSDPWPHQPQIGAESAGILLEAMRDLLYQTFVRKARLRQAMAYRRFVAPGSAEISSTTTASIGQ